MNTGGPNAALTHTCTVEMGCTPPVCAHLPCQPATIPQNVEQAVSGLKDLLLSLCGDMTISARDRVKAAISLVWVERSVPDVPVGDLMDYWSRGSSY